MYNYAMVSLITLPIKIIKLFESNTSTREIALGVVLALFLGFIPMNGPMALLLFVIFLVFQLNRVSTALMFPVFKVLYLLGVSGLTEKVGVFVLIDMKSLSWFWSWLTHMPVIAFLDVNNTLVAGGLVFSGVLAVPVYFISKTIITNLRDKYDKNAKGTKLVKLAKKLNPFQGFIDSIDRVKQKLK